MSAVTSAGKNQAGRNRILAIAIAALLYLVLVGFFISFSGRKVPERAIDDENFHCIVTHADGHVVESEGNLFKASKDDQVEVTIQTEEYGIEHPMLRFNLSHCRVEVWCDGVCLMADEELPKGRSYGTRRYFVPIPEDCLGEDVTVRFTVPVQRTITSLSFASIVPAESGRAAILNGAGFVFVTFLTLSIIALALTLGCVVLALIQRQQSRAVHLTIFVFLVCVWFMASNGYLPLLFDWKPLVTLSEYPTLMAAPIAMSILMADEFRERIPHLVCRIQTTVFTLYLLAAVILEHSPLDIHYTETLMGFHILLVPSILFYIIAMVMDSRKNGVNSARWVMRLGICLSMIVCVAEVIRVNVSAYIKKESVFAKKSFGAEAILILVITMIIYYIIRFSENEIRRIEQNQLEILAYWDSLSRIPNRTGCYRSLRQLKESGRKDYVMCFLDLNNLKLANDEYGHEAGDRMICEVADALKKAFEGNGFYGRWGGDEFIGCVYGTEAEARSALDKFNQAIEELNQKKIFPFKVTVAVGFVTSTAGEPLDPSEAVEKADAVMYEVKLKMKGIRKRRKSDQRLIQNE